DALKFYSENCGHQEWSGTVQFLSLILKLWNIVNVSSASMGMKKRDISRKPVTSAGDWKLEFLAEFSDFLQLWVESERPGLTKETFLAVKQTYNALAEVTKFCLQHLGFRFVLLAHFQSDALENRFGWYRQMAGKVNTNFKFFSY
ncbi:MAG: hypothetical protein GY820_11140, partial [Gammaproteobacteria bacterium]|nr:hypothetical protein [Gammaproteobacteria bacterium]